MRKFTIILSLIFIVLLSSVIVGSPTEFKIVKADNIASSSIIANRDDTFAVSLYIDCDDNADSFSAVEAHINFDNSFIAISHIQYNADVIYDIGTGLSGETTDLNGASIRFQTLVKFKNLFDNNSGTVSLKLLVVDSNLLPTVQTRLQVKIATIYCTALANTTTYLSWNSSEPRKSTLSQAGIDVTDSYDSAMITINQAPVRPIINYPLFNADTSSSSLTVRGTKGAAGDKVNVYLDGVYAGQDNAGNAAWEISGISLTTEKTYQLSAVSIDGASNRSNTSSIVLINYDKTSPAIDTITVSPASPFLTTSPTITVNWSDTNSGPDSGNTSITLDSGSGEVNYTSAAVLTDSGLTLTPVLTAGTYTVKVTASDIAGNSSDSTNNFVIVTNFGPKITDTIPNQSDVEDTALWVISLTKYESDANDTNLSWSVTDVDTIASIYVVAGDILTIRPLPDRYGVDTITLYLTDGKDTVFQQITVTLTDRMDTPATPELTSPGNNYETESYSCTLTWVADTTNIETYVFEVATDYNFETDVIYTDTLTTNSYYIGSISQGQYYWRVRAYNNLQYGSWSGLRIVSFGVDLTPPVITKVTIKDEDGSINIDNSDDGIKLSATINDSNTLKTVAFYIGINDTTYTTNNYSYASPAGGEFSYTFSLTSSLKTGDTVYYKVYASDNNNNDTVSYSYIVVGEISVDSPLFNDTVNIITNQSPYQINGTKMEGSTVKINSVYTATSTSDTEWSINFDLYPGTNTISANAMIGSVISDTRQLIILYDSNKPTASDNIPSSIQITDFVITITATDDLSGISKVYFNLNNTGYTMGSTIPITVDGDYSLKYYAVDNAGNTGAITTAANTARLDKTPPDTVAVNDDGSISRDLDLEFSWSTPSDSNPVVNYFIWITSSSDFSDTVYSGWTGDSDLSLSVDNDQGISALHTYYAKVKSRDAAGNISDFGTPSDGIYVDTSITDTTPPGVPTIDAVTSPTTQQYYRFSGTQDTDATIILVNGSQADLDNSANTWSKQILLQNGSNLIIVQAKDQYGNASETATVTIILDNTPPSDITINVVSPTNISPQTITGIKDEESETVYINGNTATITSDTTWEYTLALTNGNNSISAVGVDAIGNFSDTATETIIFDDVAPSPASVTYVSPYANYTQLLTGTYDTSASIVKVNGSNASTIKDEGKWNYTFSLSEGVNDINIITYDAAGNSSTTTITITRDLTPPDDPVITSPLNNSIITVSPITVSGTVPSDAYGVEVNSHSDTDVSGGTWSMEIALADGNNFITAKSFDSLNNKSVGTTIKVEYNPTAFIINSMQLDGKNILSDVPDSLVFETLDTIDTSTLTSSVIYLQKEADTISGTIEYNNDATQIYFIPDTPLRLHSTYKFTVTTGLKNITGKSLTQTKEWSFRAGTDNVPPVITDISITDDEKEILIDNSDIGVTLSARIYDTGTSVANVIFYIGVNDTNYNTNNYTSLNPDTEYFSRLLLATLHTDDTVYWKIFAMDEIGNTDVITGYVTIGNVVVPTPTIDSTVDTTVNYTPLVLTGGKHSEASVYVNGNIATNLSSIRWSYGLKLIAGNNPVVITGKIATSISEEFSTIVVYDKTAPTATDDIPSDVKASTYTVTITGTDEQSGIKRTLISLNGSEFIETNTVLISTEYKNKIKYVVENNCEIWSDTYTKYAYYDITPPATVNVLDEGSISISPKLTWSWDIPSDSSSIAGYHIQVSEDTVFDTYIVFDSTIMSSQSYINLTSANGLQEYRTYYCRVIAIDAAGNRSDTGDESNWSDGIEVNPEIAKSDTIPPEIPVITYPENEHETNVLTITVRGTKVGPDAKVVIVNGLQANLDDDYSWHREIKLSAGDNIIYVSAKDEIGNESTQDTIIVYLNTNVPKDPEFTNTVTIINDTTFTLTGTKESNTIIKIDGSTEGIISDARTFSKTVIQEEGTKKYSAIVYNSIGNYSETAYITITVDLTPPDTPTVSYTDLTNKTSQLLNGTMEQGSSLSINDTTEQILVFGGNWSYEVKLSSGTNIFHIISSDAAGNTSGISIEIELDLTPPDNPKILSPPSGKETTLSPIEVKGSKPSNCTVVIYVNGTLAQTSGDTIYTDTSWSVTDINLFSGVNVVTAKTVDQLGNESIGDQIIITFDVDLFIAECAYLENKLYVETADSIVITINRQLNLATKEDLNSYVSLNESGRNINPLINYTETSEEINYIKINYDLKPNKDYQLILKKSITSIDGKNLSQDRFWLFSTTLKADKLQNIDFNNNTLQIEIPPFTIPENAYFTSTIRNANETILFNADQKLTRTNPLFRDIGLNRVIYDIHCSTTDGDTVTTFLNGNQIKVTILYKDEDNDGVVDLTNIKEVFLKVFYLNADLAEWQELSGEVDSVNNTITYYTNHLSVFSLFGSVLDNNEVWIYPNPTADKKVTLKCRPIQTGPVSIKVFTPQGLIVYEKDFNFTGNIVNDAQLTLSGLSMGGYFMEVNLGGITKIIGLGIGK